MKNQKGMTLVEVLVAMVIISLALITMLDMFDLGLNTTSKAEKETKALQLAQFKIEELKNKINNDEMSFAAAEITRTAFAGAENAGYEFQASLTEVSADILQIRVEVFYDSSSVVLITRLGDR